MKVLFVCSGNTKNFKIIPFIKEQGESLKNEGIEVDYYPIIGKGLPGYYKACIQLRKYLMNKHYDLIHAHYTLSGWTAILAARNTPVVLSLMGDDACGTYVGVNKVQFKSKIGICLTKLIQPFVKAIISKSPNIEKHVYLKNKSYIIPNGIDIHKFSPKLINDENDGICETKMKKVLFLGNRDNHGKNFKLAKNAFESLKLTDVELMSPYPIAHSEVSKYLNSASVLLFPSLNEGSPNLIKEAMACNCPIVSTDTGDVRWVFGETKGCYIASFDMEDFAAKIQQALCFSVSHGRTNGRQRIIDLGLDSKTVAKKIIDLYKTVLKVSARSFQEMPVLK